MNDIDDTREQDYVLVLSIFFLIACLVGYFFIYDPSEGPRNMAVTAKGVVCQNTQD